MNVFRGAFLVTAILSLTACPKDDTEGDATAPIQPATTIAPDPPAVASTPAAVKPEGPAKASITPRVRSELDGRADGITGSPVAVTGALASLQAPTGWTITKGDVTVAATGDKKAQLAATSFGPEGATGKLPAATAALGLTSCEWGPIEPLTVGKGKLAASASDGVCSRGGTQVGVAYVTPPGEKLLVLGSWDPGGDSANVFGSMRSIAKATGTGDASGIGACCAALRQNAKSAPPDQQALYMFGASTCDALKNDPNGRAVLAQVRAALAGANIPSTCR